MSRGRPKEQEEIVWQKYTQEINRGTIKTRIR